MWRELKIKILAEQVLKTQVLIRRVLLYLKQMTGHLIKLSGHFLFLMQFTN